MVKVFQPSFLSPHSVAAKRVGFSYARIVATVLIVAGGGYLLMPASVDAAESLTADEIVEQVNQVDDGEFVSRKLIMHLIDRRGKERVRETIAYRKYIGDEKHSVLFYQKPTNVKDTAFLTWDYPNPELDDDQWLYLPALRRVRRISASDRGDYFLGTDFTYEDIKLEGKLEPFDYNFTLLGEETVDGTIVYKLASTPKNSEIAEELGYGRSEFWVDSSNWMVIKADFWDPKNQPLKSLQISDIRQIDGIWTRHELAITNHKTGHQTRFVFSEVDYQSPVEDSLFTQRALARGH